MTLAGGRGPDQPRVPFVSPTFELSELISLLKNPAGHSALIPFAAKLLYSLLYVPGQLPFTHVVKLVLRM